MTDKVYCMSSFLTYRTICDHSKRFADHVEPKFYDDRFPRKTVYSSAELKAHLQSTVEAATKGGKAALALSGGIDSAILAKFMPKGSVAYTFRCVVPGIQVTDESPQAARYAEECGLEHRIVDIYWEDVQHYAPLLMKRKGAPIHSIEVQIAKAAEQAKKDGFDCLIFGESADVNYGGHSGLLSKDWLVGEFVDRYSYIRPYQVLKDSVQVLDPYFACEEDGFVNVHEFARSTYYTESMGSYTNACDTVGLDFEAPYARTYMGDPLNLARIRYGDNKYWVREIFEELYPIFQMPEKLPMPRPTNEWFKDWEGPKRPEFWPHCTDRMTGDQKWLVYCLEQFLDLIDEGM